MPKEDYTQSRMLQSSSLTTYFVVFIYLPSALRPPLPTSPKLVIINFEVMKFLMLN